MAEGKRIRALAFPARRPIRVPKAAELVARRIRGEIIRRELSEGDSLPLEAQLMAQFEVSRPTIREAMRILESESLIVLQRGARGGAKVQPFDGTTVARATGFMLQAMGATIGDVYHARTLIEPEAAKLAAEGRPAEAAAALREKVALGEEAARQTRTSEDLENVRLATVAFHRTLLQQSGNITLTVIACALDDVVDQHHDFVYRKQSPEMFKERLGHIQYGFRSQERLIQMIEQGLGDAAKAHWHRHMVNAGDFWLDSVASKAFVEITS